MFKIITLPFDEDMEEFDQDRLEREFLFALKDSEIKKYKPELVEIDGRYYWTVFVEYEKIKKKKVKMFLFRKTVSLGKIKIWKRRVCLKRNFKLKRNWSFIEF